MWIINRHNVQTPISSKGRDNKALKYSFQIRDRRNGIIATGNSSKWMDPAPLWEAGLRLGGDTIWYAVPGFLTNWEQYVAHRDRGL